MKVFENRKGFTLVEVIISVAIFVIVGLTVYQLVISIIRGIRFSREEIVTASLADQYIEIARNLPYSQIGTISGNPNGNLPDLANPLNYNFNGAEYQIYYAVSYVDDPSDGTILAGTDFAPNDYKQLKLYVTNLAANKTSSFLTNIAPRGLEDIASGGALFISVINAAGNPVPGASINITNTAVIPNINLTRTSGQDGNWIEVGLPNSVNSYHIVATKNGHSTDQTYPITGGNPNPVKPDATISNGQVTKISFAIDFLSDLTFNTFDRLCAPIPSVGIKVTGEKLIGLPDILKFDHNYTSDANGQVPLNNIEWDVYTPTLLGSTYQIYGSSPIQQVNLLPDTNQTFTLILGPVTSHSLLVIVKDASTGTPIEGATVRLEKTSAIDITKITGGSVLSQKSWMGGPGQVAFIDPTKYFSDDGNIKNTGSPAGLRLKKIGSKFANSGLVESSTFDTGTASTTYTTINWQPTSQDPTTSLKFQIATNNDNATWNFVGPDGTANSYYTVSGTSISTVHNENRYFRYKVFLSSTNGAKTPILTSLNINYVSGCFTPGQVMFEGVPSYAGYEVTVSMPGYQTQNITGLTISGYQVIQVSLSP
ncbi:MAG TPA: prepilin-type N-terminal cleavage/methylation domain-containing protein [Candidatus Paceibacterota bacterium]